MYVAISDRFESDVRSQIRLMADKEYRAIDQQNPLPRIDGTEKVFLEQLWKEHLPLKDQMPTEWLMKITNFNMCVAFVGLDGNTWNTNYYVTPLAPIYAPPSTGTYGLVLKADASDKFEPYRQHARARNEAENRWGQVTEQVCGFLSKCKSLNEALKLWPQIEPYIPQHYMKKAQTKKAGGKRDSSEAIEAAKQLDTETLTAAAVISRMSDNTQ
jgi:hypothetical protein